MTLYGEKEEIEKTVFPILSMQQHTLESSRRDVSHFWGLDARRNGTEPILSKPNGEWERTAESMMLNFAESGHPVFRATSASERGELKSKAERRGEERSAFTSTEVKKPSYRFFALLFLSICSVSTEQSQICAKNKIRFKKTNRR